MYVGVEHCIFREHNVEHYIYREWPYVLFVSIITAFRDIMFICFVAISRAGGAANCLSASSDVDLL